MLLRKMAFSAWLAFTLVLGAFTTATHSLALPKSMGSELRTTVLSGLHPGEPLAVHVLYASCKCSGRILDALAARRVSAKHHEIVLAVGDFGAKAIELERAGYEVRSVTRDELVTRYGIEAAPLLVVLSRSGSLLYAGGYRRTENGPSMDREILEHAARGESSAELPLFGCAVSQSLRAIVDPFRLKD